MIWGTPTMADSLAKTRAMSAPTIVEVFIEKDSIRMELEIGATDLKAFRDLLPAKVIKQFGLPATDADVTRRTLFLQNGLVLKSDGKIMTGVVKKLEARKRLARDKITGKPLLKQPIDRVDVVYAEIHYATSHASRRISIQPPTNPDSKRVAANIGFITYHCGLPVMDFRYLTQQETLHLDWDDPWYSKFSNQHLKRHIDAPLSVFLYVEHFEVRVEVVLRPVDMQRWIELDLDKQGVIPIVSQAEIKRKIASFLSEKHRIQVDGKDVQGELARIHFLNRSLRKTGVIHPDRELPAVAATLGIIYTYPIECLPQQVDLHWEIFDAVIPEIPATTIDEAGGLPSELSPTENTLSWINYLTNPETPAIQSIPPPHQPATTGITWITVVCLAVAILGMTRWFFCSKAAPRFWLIVSLMAVAGWPLLQFGLPVSLTDQTQIDEAEAKDIVGLLLRNIYHAFDYRKESLVYDKLEISLSGDILKEAYLQTRQQIELEDQGGAQVKIDQVILKHQQIDALDDDGFSCRCRWIASGTIGHWGHIHRREIEYAAEMRVDVVKTRWKITALQVMDEHHAATSTSAGL